MGLRHHTHMWLRKDFHTVNELKSSFEIDSNIMIWKHVNVIGVHFNIMNLMLEVFDD